MRLIDEIKFNERTPVDKILLTIASSIIQHRKDIDKESKGYISIDEKNNIRYFALMTFNNNNVAYLPAPYKLALDFSIKQGDTARQNEWLEYIRDRSRQNKEELRGRFRWSEYISEYIRDRSRQNKEELRDRFRWSEYISEYIRDRSRQNKEELRGKILKNKRQDYLPKQRKGPRYFRKFQYPFPYEIFLDTDSPEEAIGLEIGFFIVQKYILFQEKILTPNDLLPTFKQFINEHLPHYFDEFNTGDFLNVLPNIINNWFISKNPLGLKYHIGLYLENIKRQERKKEFFDELTDTKTKALKHLYYLKSIGKIDLNKKNRNSLLNEAMLDLSKKQEIKEIIAAIVAKNSILPKSIQRLIQRKFKSHWPLKKIKLYLNSKYLHLKPRYFN